MDALNPMSQSSVMAEVCLYNTILNYYCSLDKIVDVNLIKVSKKHYN